MYKLLFNISIKWRDKIRHKQYNTFYEKFEYFFEKKLKKLQNNVL